MMRTLHSPVVEDDHESRVGKATESQALKFDADRSAFLHHVLRAGRGGTQVPSLVASGPN